MSKIKWIEPNDNNDINYNDDFIVIFKHSYRCIISRIVLKKFEFDYKDFSNIKFYLIDVVKNKKLQDVKIESGTQPNSIIKIKSQGLPSQNSSRRGDLFVHVVVEIPKKISKQQKSLLGEFQNSD